MGEVEFGFIKEKSEEEWRNWENVGVILKVKKKNMDYCSLKFFGS